MTEITHLLFAQEREMEENFKRLRISGQNDEF